VAETTALRPNDPRFGQQWSLENKGRVEADIDAPEAFSANLNQSTTSRRKLQVVVDVEIIDQIRVKTLWAKKGITVDGSYAENGEAAGRKQAVEKIVNEVIEGAQSQW